jgi:hypothetical protein
MAIVLNQAAQISGGHEFKLPAIELGKFLDRIPFRFPRFPAWFPGPGGATHPIAAYAGLRDFLRRANLPWRAVLSYRQTKTNLAEALKRGFPTLIYGVGSTGIPHVVVPVRKTEGAWQILDPGYPTNRNPIMWSDDQLLGWWTNFSFIRRER